MQQKPFAISLDVGTSHLNKTGSWRTHKPTYVDRIPPCNKICPTGENIQGWLSFAEEKDYQSAWTLLMNDNPFPAVMGRVCYHPCETACNRNQLDQPVAINAVERFIGEQGIRHNWQIDPGKETNKKVMIVGAGPGGMSTAYHLRRFGHQVTIYEAADKAGGMLRYGIPKYRLPREKLNAEIHRLEEMGVKFYFNTYIKDIEKVKKEEGFDAVVIAIGAQKGRHLTLAQKGDLPILDALKVLRDIELDQHLPLSGKVVIYGGGNTAMDIARSAIRMGADETIVVSRGSKNNLSAHNQEIKEAVEEGVILKDLRQIHSIENNIINLQVMLSREQHQTGETHSFASSEFEKIEADVLILAVGQEVDQQVISKINNLNINQTLIDVNSEMSTNVPGFFAVGDVVPSLRSVTTALGHGKNAARNINAFLFKENYIHPRQNEEATFDKLEPWYYEDAPRSIQPVLDLVRRKSGFAEIVGNLDEENAKYEARRCMSCGNCFECDNCYGVCPDNAIIKLGSNKGFEFKYDYCKGCGICESECPCGAIAMMAEEI